MLSKIRHIEYVKHCGGNETLLREALNTAAVVVNAERNDPKTRPNYKGWIEPYNTATEESP